MSNTLNIMNRQMYSYHLELQGLRGTVHELLNRKKIQQFYTDNGLRINSLMSVLDTLRLKYYQVNEKGETLFVDNKPVFKEGMKEEDFLTEHNDIMRNQTVIVLP